MYSPVEADELLQALQSGYQPIALGCLRSAALAQGHQSCQTFSRPGTPRPPRRLEATRPEPTRHCTCLDWPAPGTVSGSNGRVASHNPATMRPRIVFAILLALGAALHLILLVRPPGSLSYLSHYLGWLLPSVGVVAVLWVTSSAPSIGSVRRGPARSTSEWRTALAVFALLASLGLVIHVLGPYSSFGWNPSIAPRKQGWNQSSAMFFLLALCVGGCWGLLRGAPGDTTAPIPDGSRLVSGGSIIRRLAGGGLACWGAWLFVAGIRNWGHQSDGVDRLLTLMFVVSGPLWFLIGLALALRGKRDVGSAPPTDSTQRR